MRVRNEPRIDHGTGVGGWRVVWAAAGLMKVKTQRATISTPNEKRERDTGV